VAHPTGMQHAFQINELELLTCQIGHIVSLSVFPISPNRISAKNGKAAATGIANGFGISTHDVYSLSDSRLQEVRG